MKVLMTLLLLLMPITALAVTDAEDIATTIMLRGYPCGGSAVTDIREQSDGAGNRTIIATCPNGQRYRIDVSSDGKVTVRKAG